MSSKISKPLCLYCLGPHKQNKCGQFIRDDAVAELLAHCFGRDCNPNTVSKNILRMTINKIEMGIYYCGKIVKPENDWRSKPLNKFTKKQLIYRYCKISADIDRQVDELDNIFST